MANIFGRFFKGIGRLFGLSSQKKTKVQPATSIFESPELRQFRNIVREKLKSRGVGIPRKTVAELEAGFEGLTAEDIAREKEASAAALSAVDLGRSSLRGAQAGRAERLGRLYLRNRIARLRTRAAELKREDIREAERQIASLGRADIAQLGRRAGFARTEFRRRESLTSAGIGRLVSIASLLGAPILRSIFENRGEAPEGDVTADPKQQSSDFLKELIEIGSQLAAQVTIAG